MAKAKKKTLRQEIADQFRGHDAAKIAEIAENVKAALGWPGELALAMDGIPKIVLAAAADVARFRGNDAAKAELHGQEHAEWRGVYYALLFHMDNPNRYASIARDLQADLSA